MMDCRGTMRLISPHTHISVLVKNQDEALKFYTEVLGLEKRKDMTFGPGLRLLTVAPPGQQKPELVLAIPDASLYGEDYVHQLVEDLAQKLVSIFVTNDCQKSYVSLSERGVVFMHAPRPQMYGVEAVFRDPDGNVFSLLETTASIHSLMKNIFVGSAA
jgi:catechol 2,3-dioxygenase-like lactoylglutathione lyase family enzyme